MVFILRIFLLSFLLIGLYWCINYWLNPQRKLTHALKQKKTLMMDDKTSVHRNFLVAHKGVLFEGEKYMGTADQGFHIIKIHVWARDHQKLVGLEKKDFEFLNTLIGEQYPHAQITWRSPIQELLHKDQY